MFINSVIYFLALLLFEVNSQVCFKEKVATRLVLRTRLDGSRMKMKYVTEIYMKSNKTCCDGYRKLSFLEPSYVSCEPICKLPCIHGFCKRPEECACNNGYTKSNGTCVPVCKEDCSHGTCVGPNICECNPGYKLVNDTCQPICTKPCINSICSAPETCVCLPGFYSDSFFKTNVCKPYCSKCEYGFCVAPGICDCHPGWRMDKVKKICVPSCKLYPCGNGTCAAPELCICWMGYVTNYTRLAGKGDGPVCVPSCRGCRGVCVAPNKCVEEHNLDYSTYKNRLYTTTTTVSNFMKSRSSTSSSTSFTSTTSTSPTSTTSTRPTSTTSTSPRSTTSTSPRSTTSTSPRSTTSTSPTSTTSTSPRSPTITTTAHKYYNNNHDTTTTTVSYILKGQSSTSTSSTSTTSTNPTSRSSTDRVVDEKSDVTMMPEPIKNSWMQQYGMSILIPVAVLVIIGIIMLLVWQRIPMKVINFFRGKSYNVQDALLKRIHADSFENFVLNRRSVQI